MTYDRQIIISTAGSRRATKWPPSTLWWSELVERLRVPTRGVETLAAYLAMPKQKQDELKDVGGFVAGTLQGNRRKAKAVTGRDVVTIDADSIPAGSTADVLRRVEGLGCGYCIYSTRKHEEGRPRLRILLPLSRTCTADEYEPIARKLAELIGMELCDPTTFEASRLMYFPSCCTDSHYVFTFSDKPFVDADGVLGMYHDWRNVLEWPQVPGVDQAQQRLAAKQGDPTTKSGIVGAFCRTYDIYRAMDELLPGAYAPTDIPDRYTFAGGSTTGGAVVYDHGQFLFSHHATDPCSSKLVNAFDLVRLHRFGDQDDDVDNGAKGNRLPSFLAMQAFANSLPDVTAQQDQERYTTAVAAFEGMNIIPSSAWLGLLKRSSDTGAFEKTAQNVQILLENDPRFAGKIGFDEFSHRAMVLDELPWDKKHPRPWTDADRAFLQIEAEKLLKIPAGSGKVDTAFTACVARQAYHPIRNYLNSLQWDGVPRLDALFIDYLGAEDTQYTRAVTRKIFVAAVARVMNPGVKHDCMVILYGPQGGFKSTLLRIMSGDSWFNDSIKTLAGKDAMEALRGTWFVEFAELEAFKQAEVTQIKSYLSSVMDRFRVAYGRNMEDFPRQCIFFGTTNKSEFLKDQTGNRRFLPVQTDMQQRTKSVVRDLHDERDQLWAEAVIRWQVGEKLFLTGDLAELANAIQEQHREVDPWESLITDFIEKPLPVDWDSWSLEKRRMYWAGSMIGEIQTTYRRCVCPVEIWCEALSNPREDMEAKGSRRIVAVLANLHDWEKVTYPDKYAFYGSQRGYRRKDLQDLRPQKSR